MRPRLKVSLAFSALGPALVAAPAGAVSGGATLPIEQAPYVAWLGGRCTGTLISPTRILTAGHCLDGQSATDADVVVGLDGSQLTPKQEKAARLEVRGYSVHPKFKLSFPFAHDNPEEAIAINDVGLILLKKPVTNIAPVRLAGPGDAALEAPGTAVTLIGYGIIAPNTQGGPPTGRAPLQQGAVTVINSHDCSVAYPRAIQSSMICTHDLMQHAPLIQACAGDSGGPTIVSTPSGPVQIGVTSWGPEVMGGDCGVKPLPQVPMRVSAFASFINAKDPVIEPFAKGSRGAGVPKIVGLPHIGHTVTCKPPKLGGDRFTLSYAWQLAKVGKIKTLSGAHKATLKITKALYRKSLPDRRLFCSATATNAGGHWSGWSGSARPHK
jgi:secreted trypsin-like serine protease